VTTPGRVAASIDVGGSNLRVGVVSDSGEVLERLIEPTPTSHSAHDVVEAIVRCLRQVAAAQGIGIDELSGIGIGIPGPVDPVTGVRRLSPNLGWMTALCMEPATPDKV
jgi:glucokinase